VVLNLQRMLLPLWLLNVTLAVASEAPAELKLIGDWDVQVRVTAPRAVSAVVHVSPPPAIEVRAEKSEALPLYNPRAGGWVKGAQLRGVRAQETTTPFLLDPASLVLRLGADPDSPPLAPGRDYEADLSWGTIGRTTRSVVRPDQPVFASYHYTPLRLDAVVLTPAGRIILRAGEPRAAAPLVPKVAAGERHLANIWLSGRLAKLSDDHLFPVPYSTLMLNSINHPDARGLKLFADALMELFPER
jgi:hypothetical protein